MIARMSDEVPQRERARVVVWIWVLLFIHAALVDKAYGDVPTSALMILGAYNGALGAFAGSLGICSAYHVMGARPGARLHHIFLVAWALFLVGGAFGAAFAPLCAYAPLVVRAPLAALIAPGTVTVIAARLTSRALAALKSSTSP